MSQYQASTHIVQWGGIRSGCNCLVTGRRGQRAQPSFPPPWPTPARLSGHTAAEAQCTKCIL